MGSCGVQVVRVGNGGQWTDLGWPAAKCLTPTMCICTWESIIRSSDLRWPQVTTYIYMYLSEHHQIIRPQEDAQQCPFHFRISTRHHGWSHARVCQRPDGLVSKKLSNLWQVSQILDNCKIWCLILFLSPEDECYYRVPRRAWCHEARKMTRAEALVMIMIMMMMMMMIMMIMAGMAAEHGGPDPGGLQRLQRVQTSLD